MTGIHLQNRIIGRGHPVFIIAEAGVNHNGDLGMAMELVDIAADSGADAVKFQTFRTDHLILQQAPKAQYHIETTGSDSEQSWTELLKSQELNAAMHEALVARCEEKRILFLSTPYDEPSVDLLDALDVALFKIASTDADNIAFLQYVASKGRPMILSTAMSTLAEVKTSVEAIRRAGINDLIVMQCTGSYPAPAAEANLRAMKTIEDECGVAIGYSDHVPGGTVATAAIALGAAAYEKHFTIDRTLPGPDHRASLEPNELKALITSLRDTEAALGDGVKRVMPCETENRSKLRKFVVAARAIHAGERLERPMLTTKRTGGVGQSAGALLGLIGKSAATDIELDQPITADNLTD